MVECNRGCGVSTLHWKVVNGKYKLFNHEDLLHVCNDGEVADLSAMEKATAKILVELGIDEPARIPVAEPYVPKKKENKVNQLTHTIIKEANGDPKKMFTINSTASGIAITGDDKHNAIYVPKIAIPEMVKALVDFIC